MMERILAKGKNLFERMTEEQFRRMEEYIGGFGGIYLDLRKDDGRAYYEVGRGFAITDFNTLSLELENVGLGVVNGVRKIGELNENKQNK